MSPLQLALSDVTLWQELETLGFRGEALSSLCALADVSVVTRQAEQPAGSRLQFDHAGTLQSKTAAARSTGTTLSIKDVFKPLPVRYKVAQRPPWASVRQYDCCLYHIKLPCWQIIADNVQYFTE